MIRGIVRWASRQMSTASTTSSSKYPFSKVVSFVEPPPEPPTDALRKGKGLMEHVRKALVAPEKRYMMTVLFSRRHPLRLRPGTVLTVQTQQAPFSFSGVLLSIRRRGPDTSFVLRNIVQKMGVEMQFFVNSPDLKQVDVNKLAEKPKGGKRIRRAKLFYLRHQPEKMTAISAGVRG